MTIRVQSGFADQHRSRAAALFWAAFEQKLGWPLGPSSKALRFIEGGLNPEFAFSATSEDGRLLGIAGVRTAKGGLFSADLRSLAQVYGWFGALWRGAMLELFERDVQGAQLLMDGLFVAAEAQGQGVGTKLLDAVIWCATMNRCTSVRLDVTDSNPRARALYERYGFEAVTRTSTGVMSHVMGFKHATTMVFVIPEAEPAPPR